MRKIYFRESSGFLQLKSTRSTNAKHRQISKWAVDFSLKALTRIKPNERIVQIWSYSSSGTEIPASDLRLCELTPALDLEISPTIS